MLKLIILKIFQPEAELSEEIDETFLGYFAH